MELIVATGTVPQSARDLMPSGGTPGWATDGNPALNILPTGDLACHYNMMMAEIVQVILDAGGTLDRTNWGQLSAAIKSLIAIETLRATTVESNLQSSKAAAVDLASETTRAEAAEATKVSGTYGVGSGAFAGKALIQGSGGPAFCYNNGAGDIWVPFLAALTDSTRSGIVQLGYNFNAGHLDAVDGGGVTHSFLPTAQQTISGGTLTQIGNQKWMAFYIDSISGSGAQITFPAAFSALPTVLLLPTNENGTNLAIQANPVKGSLTNTGLQVNINNGPGSASTAGCGLWVWAFGAL